MMLREKIHADLLNAMKAKEELKVSVLRLLKAAIMKFEVSGETKVDADDEKVLQLIQKEVKQRQDSVASYQKGGRAELAAKEEQEIKILETYLPPKMSDTELKGIIEETIAQTGAKNKSEFGKVMGALMPKVKGKADGQVVSKMVGELLK